MMTALSQESIVAMFPHPNIPHVLGMPSYETIYDVHTKLKENAAIVPTTLGGGAHGHLGLLLGPATYHALTGEDFDFPNDPGATPTIPAGTNVANTNRLIREHTSNLKTFQECLRTDNALKQQIQDAFDPVYLRGLRNRHTAFANVRTLQMIQHLYTNYGPISQVDLDSNHKRLNSPYDPSVPIEILFQQIEDAVEYADAANAPFSDAQIVNAAYLHMLRTGVYKDACKEWNRRPANEKTWQNFKTDFTAAYVELLHFQNAEQEAGIINQVEGMGAPTAEAVNAYHRETTDAINALAAATAADRNCVANLTQANATLSEKVTELTSCFTRLDGKLNQLIATTNSLRANTGNADNSNQPTRPNSAARRAANTSYCWTHGRTHTNNHTSENCRNPAPGHQSGATLTNRMGGSTFRCE